MNKNLIIGIDIGTSGCKTIVIDSRGEVIDSVTKDYPLYNPEPGWSEQNPEDWWQAVKITLKEIINKNSIMKDAIKIIGLCGQMHGLVVMDENDQVLRSAILWNDQRTEAQCQKIYDQVGGEEELLKYTNNNMLPGYTASKILWLREEEPEIYEKANKFVNPKDYIRFKLTGEYATEVSDASGTGLFDVKNREWNQELLSILDISTDLLPTCFESTEITGNVTKEVSEDIGLPEDLPIAGGGGDAVIQTTGTGLIKEGILGTTIGTAGIVAMGLDKFTFNSSGNLQLFCNNAPDKWHIMGVNLSAGGAYQWYENNLCRFEEIKAQENGKNVYEILDKEIQAADIGSKNLMFLPYLIGERCPYSDPDARGAFIGLTLRHDHKDMTRAVQEGVIYNLRHVYELMLNLNEALKATEIRTSGGGSKSQVWRQIQSNIFQLPVKTLKGSSQGGAYGAALVAGVGCGIWNDIEEAVDVLEIETETYPDPEVKDKYDELFAVYKNLYSNLKNTFTKLSKIDKKY